MGLSKFVPVVFFTILIFFALNVFALLDLEVSIENDMLLSNSSAIIDVETYNRFEPVKNEVYAPVDYIYTLAVMSSDPYVYGHHTFNDAVSNFSTDGFIVSRMASVAAENFIIRGNGYVLLIEKYPSDGGSVSPGIGVRDTFRGERVLLHALPATGYRFLHWLGDVADATDEYTSVMADSSKTVIAVFVRDINLSSSSGGGGGGGGGGLVQGISYSSGGGSVGSGSGSGSGSSPSYNPEPILDPIPDPVPEPVSFVLLGTGLLMLRSKRRSLRRS